MSYVSILFVNKTLETKALGAHQHTLFKRVFMQKNASLCRNVKKNMPKNAPFLEKSCKVAAVFIHWPLAAAGSASSPPYCYSRL